MFFDFSHRVFSNEKISRYNTKSDRFELQTQYFRRKSDRTNKQYSRYYLESTLQKVDSFNTSRSISTSIFYTQFSSKSIIKQIRIRKTNFFDNNRNSRSLSKKNPQNPQPLNFDLSLVITPRSKPIILRIPTSFPRLWKIHSEALVNLWLLNKISEHLVHQEEYNLLVTNWPNCDMKNSFGSFGKTVTLK